MVAAWHDLPEPVRAGISAMVLAARREPMEVGTPMDPREADRLAEAEGTISRRARLVQGPEGPRPRHLVHLAGQAFAAGLGPALTVLPDGRRLRPAGWIGSARHKPRLRAVVLCPADPAGPRWTIALAHPGEGAASVRPFLPADLLNGTGLPPVSEPAALAAAIDDLLDAVPPTGPDA